MNLKEHRIGIVGSGNVASHLAFSFHKNKNIPFAAIYSRNTKKASLLCKKTNTIYVQNIENLKNYCDIIILCVSDDSIPKLAKALKLTSHYILAHTSGVVSINVLKSASKNYGSFYPLQTFTSDRKVDLKSVPFLIDASNEYSKKILFSLASHLSDNVSYIKDADRQKLHLAAVVVNNFTNHLFTLAKKYTKNLSVDFKLLMPLIKETINKAIEENPALIQTGPAKRGDLQTIANHLSMIENSELKKLYLCFTKSIQEFYE